MSRGQVLWGVPPYEGWTGGAIRIEAGTRANYEERKRQGWTGLRILDQGQDYPYPCPGCDGRGHYVSLGDFISCHRCEGTGRQATA